MDDKKDIILGKLVDEYLLKVKVGAKISINDWVNAHPEAPPDELKDQLRMGILLTKVGEQGHPRPTLTDEQRSRIKTQTLDHYAKTFSVSDKAQAEKYLSEAADTFAKGDYTKTRELLNQAIPIHQKYNNYVWLGFEHSILAVTNILEDNFDSAVEHFRESDRFYRKTNEAKARAGVLGQLGMLYFTLNKLDRAEECLNQTLKLAEEIKLPEVIMSALNNLGLIELARGRYLAGFELFQKALALAQAQNDKETQAIAYSNMAESAENGRGHKTAIELYHKSLTLSREGKHYNLISQSAARLGALYASHNKWDEASQLFNEAAGAVDQIRGASTEPTAVKFRRTLGSLGMPSTEEVLTDFRRRIKEEQTVMA